MEIKHLIYIFIYYSFKIKIHKKLKKYIVMSYFSIIEIDFEFFEHIYVLTTLYIFLLKLVLNLIVVTIHSY